jgi:hypothetical protein
MSDFAQIVSFTAVDLIAFEMADLCSLAREKGIGLSVSKGFTCTCPKPINNRLHASIWPHVSLCLLNPRFELWNLKSGSRG